MFRANYAVETSDENNEGSVVWKMTTSSQHLHTIQFIEGIGLETASTATLTSKNQKDDETDYDPYAHREVTHPTSDIETLIHLLKGSLGSGLLAMPYAFLHAGLFFGLFATIIIGFVCTYCVNILVKCSIILCKRMRVPSLGFADVAGAAFKQGPPRVRKYTNLARGVINWSLITDLMGCCSVYVIFVSKNLQPVIEPYLPGLTIRHIMLILLPVFILINLVRNLKYLAPFSMIANILLLSSLIIILTYIFQEWKPVGWVPAVADVTTWPTFFGTAIFALEGVGVVMPLENQMKNPRHFGGCPGVLNIGFSIVVMAYSLLGFFGFLRYGMNTQESISLNLPPGNFSRSAQLMVAISIFFTFSLQFYVPMEIIWKMVKHRFTSKPLMAEYILRIVLVTLIVLVAVALPNLGPLMSLIGAITLSIMGLILPSVIELVVYYDEPGRYGRLHWVLWKNILIICFGILGLITGSMTSIIEMTKDYV